MTKIQSPTPLVKLTLQIGADDTYTSTGKTILKAINNLPIPDDIKAKGYIKAEINGKIAIKHFTIPTLRRLFCASGNIRNYTRTVASKHLNLFLKN